MYPPVPFRQCATEAVRAPAQVSVKTVQYEHNPWKRLWHAGSVLELVQWRAIRHEFLFPHDEYEAINGELVRAWLFSIPVNDFS